MACNMKTCFAPLRNAKVSRVLTFAALLLIAAGISRAHTGGREWKNAQQSSTSAQSPQTSTVDQPQVPTYDKAIFQKPVPSDQLAFLAKFSGATTKDVVHDKQFRKLMHSLTPDCTFHYGSDMSLSAALDMVLDGSPLPFQLRDGRYAMVSGHSGPYLAGRGFMWIDTQEGVALGGFYFRPTNGEPTPTVTVFSKQITERTLALSQLPPAFAEDFSRWLSESYIKPITTRYFITGFNEKILLEHDEDFCTPKDGPTPPPQDVCEQMNADAADIDVNAADYLEQTNHLTNGTAWMIDQDQVAWIQIRDETCRVGPDPLRCHIRMTHERIRIIVRRQPAPHGPGK